MLDVGFWILDGAHEGGIGRTNLAPIPAFVRGDAFWQSQIQNPKCG
jgi:hypothetical protein